MDDQILKLRQLTAMKLDADLMALRRISSERAGIADKKAELEGRIATARMMASRAETALVATLAQVELHESWVCGQITALNRRLAALRVEKELALDRARTSFGRHEALNAVHQRQADAAKHQGAKA